MAFINQKDFSHQALSIYQLIKKELSSDDESHSLALLTLKFKSLYEQGFAAGRYYEQFGQEPDHPDDVASL
jgi:hypothetical protein